MGFGLMAECFTENDATRLPRRTNRVREAIVIGRSSVRLLKRPTRIFSVYPRVFPSHHRDSVLLDHLIHHIEV